MIWISFFETASKIANHGDDFLQFKRQRFWFFSATAGMAGMAGMADAFE